MDYSYKAHTTSGEYRQGTIKADNENGVYKLLREQNLIDIEISEYKPNMFSEMLKVPINKKEMILFFKNMDTMLHANIPIIQAIDMICNQVKQKKFRQCLSNINQEINRGSVLSEAVKAENAFPNLVSEIIRIGEETADLPRSFRQLAEFYSNENKVQAKIIGALAYPAFTMVAAVGVTYYLTTGVLPKLIGAMPGTSNLSVPTKILLWCSEFFKKYQLWPFLALIIIIVIGIQLSLTVFKKQKDALILRIPIFGELTKKSMAVQFTSTLSILYNAGVTITDSLDIIRNLIPNESFKQNLEQVKADVIRGEKISNSLSPKLFDQTVIAIIKVGEESADMIKPLKNISEYLDEEVNRSVNTLTTMIMPVSMLVLAVVIGFIIIGTIGPMFSMYDSVG